MKKIGSLGLGLGLDTQSFGLGLGLEKKVLVTSLVYTAAIETSCRLRLHDNAARDHRPADHQR